MVKFQESYNANLANGIGNLVSRVMKMASTHLSDETMKFPEKMIDEEDAKGDNAQNGTVNITSAMIAESQIPLEYITAMDSYDIQKACNIIWKQIAEADGIIQQTAPFKLVKTDKVAAQNIIKDLCVRLYDIGIMLQPIMPETAKSIISLVLNNKSPEAPLFVRK
jgi:methionyl-tRNA synthetase